MYEDVNARTTHERLQLGAPHDIQASQKKLRTVSNIHLILHRTEILLNLLLDEDMKTAAADLCGVS